MAYEKQNFVNGQKLDASHLNAIEDGIVDLHQSITGVEDGIVDLQRFLMGEDVIFPQTTITAPADLNYTITPAPFVLVEGATYSVTIEDKTSEEVCKKTTFLDKPCLVIAGPYIMGTYYFTPEESGVDGGKVVFSGWWEEGTTRTVEIRQVAAHGQILQMQNGEAKWVEPPEESSDVPDVTVEDNGKILQVVNGEWQATELETPSDEVPVFDLADIGLPAVSLPDGICSISTDTTAMRNALSSGSVKFSIPIKVGSDTIPLYATMQGMAYGTRYRCVSLFSAGTDESLRVITDYALNVIVDTENINVRVYPFTEANGVPQVTTADNGKVLQVKNGEWAAAALDITPGSAEIPVFDLGAMGMSSVGLPIGNSSIATDTTAMISALEAGAVRFEIPTAMGTFSMDMHGMTDGSGSYQCVASAMLDVAVVVMVNVASAGIQVIVAPLATAIGVPSVTNDDNGKFMRVVDGAWATVALQDVSEVGE